MEKKEIGTMREKEFKDALQESREYLSDYICVSKDVIRAIQRHAKRYGIMPGQRKLDIARRCKKHATNYII